METLISYYVLALIAACVAVAALCRASGHHRSDEEDRLDWLENQR